jgi:hypothetical protein
MFFNQAQNIYYNGNNMYRFNFDTHQYEFIGVCQNQQNHANVFTNGVPFSNFQANTVQDSNILRNNTDPSNLNPSINHQVGSLSDEINKVDSSINKSLNTPNKQKTNTNLNGSASKRKKTSKEKFEPT